MTPSLQESWLLPLVIYSCLSLSLFEYPSMMLPTLPSITFFLEIIIVIICHFFFYLLLLLLLLPSNYHFIMLCLPCCFFHLFIFIFHFILLLLFALRIFRCANFLLLCCFSLSVCVSLNYLKCTFFLAFIVGSRLLLTLQKAPRHLFTLLPFLASSSSVVFSLSTPFGLDLSVDAF